MQEKVDIPLDQQRLTIDNEKSAAASIAALYQVLSFIDTLRAQSWNRSARKILVIDIWMRPPLRVFVAMFYIQELLCLVRIMWERERERRGRSVGGGGEGGGAGECWFVLSQVISLKIA